MSPGRVPAAATAEAGPSVRARGARGAARRRRRGPSRQRPARPAGLRRAARTPSGPRAVAPPCAAQLRAAEPSLLLPHSRAARSGGGPGPRAGPPGPSAARQTLARRSRGTSPVRGARRPRSPQAPGRRRGPRALTVIGSPVRRRQLLVRLEVLGLGLLAPRHAASGARAPRGEAASAGRPTGTARGCRAGAGRGARAAAAAAARAAHGAEQLGW